MCQTTPKIGLLLQILEMLMNFVLHVQRTPCSGKLKGLFRVGSVQARASGLHHRPRARRGSCWCRWQRSTSGRAVLLLPFLRRIHRAARGGRRPRRGHRGGCRGWGRCWLRLKHCLGRRQNGLRPGEDLTSIDHAQPKLGQILLVKANQVRRCSHALPLHASYDCGQALAIWQEHVENHIRGGLSQLITNNIDRHFLEEGCTRAGVMLCVRASGTPFWTASGCTGTSHSKQVAGTLRVA
mmetsp:Transcript_86154/g.180204  ORF Transcript_86154/g.180204 Transcript_86154/m.180204 type:complete len:239 (-) Transcript_86154:98-814(-)